MTDDGGQAAVTLVGGDAETAAADLAFTITALPTQGVLLDGTTPVTLNQTFVGSPKQLTISSAASCSTPWPTRSPTP